MTADARSGEITTGRRAESAGSRPALTCRGLVRRFGDRRALDGLDLELPAGTCSAVFGRNGSGKTTLVRLCAGLGRPDEGDLTVAGFSLPKESRRVRAAVGIVLDEPLVPLQLTLREATQYVAELADVDVQSVRDLVDTFGLGHRGRDPLSTFSRGMRQRFALAHALAGDPEVLFLDEPMNGLDPAGRELVAGIIRDRTERTRSTVIVMHDVARGLELSTYAALLERGTCVVHGASADLDPNDLEGRLS